VDVLLDQRAQTRAIVCGPHSIVCLFKAEVPQRVVCNAERVLD
jgi:hypothetical protein